MYYYCVYYKFLWNRRHVDPCYADKKFPNFLLIFHKKIYPLWSLTKYEIWDLICMIFSIKNCIEVVAMLCRTWRPKRRRNIHDSLILPQWLYCTYTSCALLLIFYHRISHLKFLHCFFCLFLYDVCQKYIVRNSKSNDK